MDSVKAKLAMSTSEFRKWMFDEIKITDSEAIELTKCSTCWHNFNWTERTLKKIDAKLEAIVLQKPVSNWGITNNLFTSKEELIEFIKNSNADAFQIITRKKLNDL